MRTASFIIAILAASSAAFAAEIIAPGAKLEKIAGDFKFTEGTSADADGNVYFTDQPNDRIMKYDTDGKLTEWMKPSGRSNGTKVDRTGHLIACADEKNELWSIDIVTKKVTVLVKDFEGKLLNGPNDVWVRPDGGLYFTDPYYKRDYWKRGPKQQGEHVYYLSPDHQKLTRVTDDLKQPNGIVGTRDGKLLYVADIGAGKTYLYDINADGTLANKRLFCSMGSDGMSIDENGNIYISGRGVTVFDKTGQKIEHIAVPEQWVGNLCFGGKDRKTLYIAASTGFYSIKLQVRSGDLLSLPAHAR